MRISGALRQLSYGSGAAYGSLLLTNRVGSEERQKTPWKVVTEYPKAKTDNLLLSRKIVSEADTSGLRLRLYQFQTCPYCCKVRAFLDYYGFSYDVVEVNSLTKSQLKFCKQHKKVPVMTTAASDEPLVESAQIISALGTYLMGPRELGLDEILSYYPVQESENPKKKNKVLLSYPNKYFIMFGNKLSEEQIQTAKMEREWREWVDEHFIHLISPNVYRTWSEALQTFRYFSLAGDWERNFGALQTNFIIYIGAAAMFMIAKRLKKRHDIHDERKEMSAAFNDFLRARNNQPFLGGKSPNLADLALYGAINSFAGCSAFTEMRQMTRIGEWYDSMQREVSEHRGAQVLAKKCKSLEKPTSVA